MLSIERVKELLNDTNISDAEATLIRDHLYGFAELAFFQWHIERRLKREQLQPLTPKTYVQQNDN